MILLNNTRASTSTNHLGKTAPITPSDIILRAKTAADTGAEAEGGETGTAGTDRPVTPPPIAATDPEVSQQMDRKLLTGDREMRAGVTTKTTTLKPNDQRDSTKNKEEEKRMINRIILT